MDEEMDEEMDIPDEIIVEAIDVPKDQVYLLTRRKPQESLAEWAKRCGVIYNIGGRLPQ